jgi:acyl-CoA synthetase (AMP-forming)/AMP-acid ligase II
MNVGRMLVNTARRLPDRPAVTFEHRTINYAELAVRADGLRRGLATNGVGKGDRVGLLMRNRPEMLEAMFACFMGGYVLVPLNARLTASEVLYHLSDSQAAALVTADPEIDVTGVRVVRIGEDYERMAGQAGFQAESVDVEADDLAWLFYTSGTTGRPKGAMLTHANLDFVTASWLADLTPMTDEDVLLHAAPLSHGAGFHAIAGVARGVHHVMLPFGTFQPGPVLDLMRESGVTTTWMVPTQIVVLADALEKGAGPVGPALRRIVYGGAPFAPADLKRALNAFGPVFVQLFGQGETPMTATVLPSEDHAAALAGRQPERLTSAGYARPGMDVRVLGDGDVELPPGQVGEVCVRGPAVMAGYWGQPDATAEALRNGWLHTGDLGRMDEHGYLYLLDRAKDMIITGGSNVYAVEVEAVLAGHPAVQEVAVVGVPDRVWGELVVAVIVTDESTDGLEAELASHCATSLAGYKRPRRWAFRAALPRNAYGKVLKRELRTDLAHHVGPE